jgi:hypothetical protein
MTHHKYNVIKKEVGGAIFYFFLAINSLKKYYNETMKKFKLPVAFLNQLREFTNGYYLVTINENNGFETFVYYPDPISEMALLNFVDIQSTAVQDIIRQKAIDETDIDEDED